jgi:tetratricopeptide (TPR) repeat protein
MDREALHRKLTELMKVPQSEPHIIVLLSEYVEREPQDVMAALRYGDALREVGRQREAIRILTRAFERATKSSLKVLLAIRIAMAFERADANEAEAWYSRAAELDEDMAGWAWVLRGANLANLERFNAAIDWCHRGGQHATDARCDPVHLRGDYETGPPAVVAALL